MPSLEAPVAVANNAPAASPMAMDVEPKSVVEESSGDAVQPEGGKRKEMEVESTSGDGSIPDAVDETLKRVKPEEST